MYRTFKNKAKKLSAVQFIGVFIFRVAPTLWNVDLQTSLGHCQHHWSCGGREKSSNLVWTAHSDTAVLRGTDVFSLHFLDAFFVVVDDLHITSINDSNRNRVQYTIHRRITDRLYLLVKRKTQSSMYYNSSKSKWKPHYRERYPCGGRGTASDDLFNGYEGRNKMWF